MEPSEYKKFVSRINYLVKGLRLQLEAEDVAHDLWINGHTTFCNQILKYKIIDMARARYGRTFQRVDLMGEGVERVLREASNSPYITEARIDIERLTRTLSNREKRFIRMFMYGYRYREIGEEFGITESRARQIIVIALEKMREAV